MSTDLTPTTFVSTDASNNQTAHAAVQPPAEHALHVKGVPLPVWQRARHNAIASALPFRSYIIRVLADSQPYPCRTPAPAQATESREAMPVQQR